MKKPKYMTQTLWNNGNTTERCFCTEEAYSNYANRCYKKDHECTVVVYDYDTLKQLTIYHA